MGKPVDIQQVREAAGPGTVGRPHVADAMVKAGYMTDRQGAFDRFLGEGMDAYVPRGRACRSRARSGWFVTPVASRSWHTRGPVMQSSTPLVSPSSGTSVSRESRSTTELHDERARSDLRAIAAELDLVVTRSSDYHGTGKKGHPLGCDTTTRSNGRPPARRVVV